MRDGNYKMDTFEVRMDWFGVMVPSGLLLISFELIGSQVNSNERYGEART